MFGTVQRLISAKGFGFVKGEDGKDRFFHRSAVRGSNGYEGLREGARVEFDEEHSDRGPRATNVRATA